MHDCISQKEIHVIHMGKTPQKLTITSSCSLAKFSNFDFKLPAAPEPVNHVTQRVKCCFLRTDSQKTDLLKFQVVPTCAWLGCVIRRFHFLHFIIAAIRLRSKKKNQKVYCDLT